MHTHLHNSSSGIECSRLYIITLTFYSVRHPFFVENSLLLKHIFSVVYVGIVLALGCVCTQSFAHTSTHTWLYFASYRVFCCCCCLSTCTLTVRLQYITLPALKNSPSQITSSWIFIAFCSCYFFICGRFVYTKHTNIRYVFTKHIHMYVYMKNIIATTTARPHRRIIWNKSECIEQWEFVWHLFGVIDILYYAGLSSESKIIHFLPFFPFQYTWIW